MNAALKKLSLLADQARIVVGLMSGTSLDALDVALCEIRGDGVNTELVLKYFKSVSYNENFLSTINPIFANAHAPLHAVTQANAYVAREHASILLACLKEWKIDTSEIDILASHGQTIFHAPNSFEHAAKSINSANLKSATLQIGDGDHLAYLTQILTVSDFRQKHIAADGEGAPLVPYADFLLFSSKIENRILLNIGGIANFTFLSSSAQFDSLISADTGPGNTLMDAAIAFAKSIKQRHGEACNLPLITKRYDKDGHFAALGTVDKKLLQSLLSRQCGRGENTEKANLSTGQEILNIDFILDCLRTSESTQLSAFPLEAQPFYDLMATLNMFTAQSIAQAINKLPIDLNNNDAVVIYVSGGGVHNTVLMQNLARCVPNIKIKTSDALGLPADAKEAALFAVLANQSLFGDSQIFTNSNGIPATTFGKISLP